MTKCSLSFLVLFLIGLGLGDSLLVILFLYSLVLFSFVLSVFLPLCLFFSFFSCKLCSASASLHLAVFLNIHISYLSKKKKKNWTLFSVWLLHLISFVSLVSWQWPQRRLLRERIGIKRGREGGWWKKQQWGCWSFVVIGSPRKHGHGSLHKLIIQLHGVMVSVDYYYYFIFKILTVVRTWRRHDCDTMTRKLSKKEEDGFENLAHVRTVDHLYLVLEGWGEIFSFKDLTYWRWA